MIEWKEYQGHEFKGDVFVKCYYTYNDEGKKGTRKLIGIYTHETINQLKKLLKIQYEQFELYYLHEENERQLT